MTDHTIPNAGDGRYRAFITHSSEGIWRLEFEPPIDTALPVAEQVDLAYRNGRFAECNLAMARMYGLDAAADLIGKPLEFVLPSSNDDARGFLFSIAEAGYRAIEVESAEPDAGGELRHFTVAITGVVENGRLLGIWGTRRDITAQKEAEQERAYLAAIVEWSDDAIISKDLNGIVRSCNAAAERLFGYSRAELVGHPVRLLIPADRQAEEDDILSRLRRGERIDHFQTVRRAKDGRLLDISLTVSPVRDGMGRVVGASKIVRDITDQKRAAAEREHLLEAERAARAEAERTSRVKDDFVAMVSHELRTPLNAILGWTQLMTRARTDPSVMTRGLDVIARNTRLQAQLISDLLDISRIVAGKLQIETRRVDLRSVVGQAIEIIEDEALAQGVAIVRELDEGVSLVSGDASRLQQVVWNLLSNAIKFTPRGGQVRVSLRVRGARALVEVADAGSGIHPDFLPRVFDRFQQADRSITRRFGGLGLGLSIVKHLVELHGGEVTAASAGEGHGATFTVSLPLVSDATDYERRRAPADGSDVGVDLDAIRLLVVEDEADTLEFLRRLLTTHGATVLTAASAGEALSLVRDGRPDLLISDIGLPEMDGYDLIQKVRRESSPGRDIPAIALTAYARSEDRTRALRAGYQAHIAKPVEPNELLAMIASFVELTGAGRRGR
jgi:PAS domain S-box-containing protein